MIGFIKFLFVVVIVLLGLAFHVHNDHLVKIDYYYGALEVSLSIVIVGAVLAGALLGMLASLGIIFPLSRERSKLNKAVKVAEQEVSNLRSIPLKDAD